MKSHVIFIFLILFVMISPVYSQEREARALFQDAESWFYYEEYAEALPLYDSLLREDPNNHNLQYKLGVCLFNDPYQQKRALSFLESAARGMRNDYKENSYLERRAPPETIYYLANAYLANEMLDLARETFEAFLIIMDREVYNEELVRAQLRACETAARMMQEPVPMILQPLDTAINTPYPEIRPVISGDGSTMAFVRKLPFYDAAYICHQTETGWSRPRLITQELGFDADVYPTGLSHDGTEMILYSDDNRTGNLYQSSLVDGTWTRAVKMGAPISTKFWESEGCLSGDGRTLYFTSNREGGFGGLDIYKSERTENGDWGEPVNLGPVINSPFNEEAPWISSDGRTLCFISFGHEKMGGYDIFISHMNNDGTWSNPSNPGYPINTTRDDLYFVPLPGGSGALYSIWKQDGQGGHDLYLLNLDEEATIFTVKTL